MVHSQHRQGSSPIRGDHKPPDAPSRTPASRVRDHGTLRGEANPFALATTSALASNSSSYDGAITAGPDNRDRPASRFRRSIDRTILLSRRRSSAPVAATARSTRRGTRIPSRARLIRPPYGSAGGFIRRKPCQSGQSSPSQSIDIVFSSSARLQRSRRNF